MGNDKKQGPEDLVLSKGPRVTHGGYTFLRLGKLPGDKVKIERWLTWVRKTYIEDIAKSEENMTAGQTILLNKLIMLEGLCRCIEIYQAEIESFKMPHQYMSYVNTIIKICTHLGIDRRKVDEGPDVQSYIAERYPEKKGKGKDGK